MINLLHADVGFMTGTAIASVTFLGLDVKSLAAWVVL